MQVEIGTELSPAEAADLRCLAAIMIPAQEGGSRSPPSGLRGSVARPQAVDQVMPGADDPLIFADIMRSLGRDTQDVRAGLAALAEQAGGRLAQLDPATAEAHALRYLGQTSREVIALGRVVLQCYYRDDRVLQALGLEARPPFPLGHKVEQGDWSLLDPVRNLPPLWRDDRERL